LEQSIHLSLEAPTTMPAQTDSNAFTTTSLLAPGATHNEGKYIEFAQPAGFVNSAPFKLADLIGKKVILLDFIDYSCINCERTFPYSNDWYAKYKDQGLEIVAIHTPEFAFEKDIANVTAAAKQFGLKFPIVLDNNYATWNAYKNEYWPHKYLIDIHGNIVYDHIGEGDYDVTEKVIVDLLNERKQFLGESGTVTLGANQMPANYAIQTDSPETYFGSNRNEYFGNGTPFVVGNRTYAAPREQDQLNPNQFYLGGDWHIDKEYAESLSATTSLSYMFQATKMYLIAQTPDGAPIKAHVLLDGKPMPGQVAGTDVKNGELTITGSRLYQLFSQPTPEPHRIDIIFETPGARVYTFTFG
jgi:thiol-disulfide isomerase/thioredoxin